MELVNDTLYVGVWEKGGKTYLLTFGRMLCTVKTSVLVWIVSATILAFTFFLIFGWTVKRVQYELLRKAAKKTSSSSSDEETSIHLLVK